MGFLEHHSPDTRPVRNLRGGGLPEQEEVALLVAVAAQRLADYIVVGVRVVSRLRKQMHQSRDPQGTHPAASCPHQYPGPLPKAAPHPEGMITVPISSPGPRHLRSLIESVQQLPHGRQVAVSDLLDQDNVIAAQDLRTGHSSAKRGQAGWRLVS